MIEAFARGRGVVATDAGGIPDLVTNGEEGTPDPACRRGRPCQCARPRSDRPVLARQLGNAAHAQLRRLALDAGGVRSRVPRAGRAHDRLMRLVFVTQTLDAEHPALAQTLDLVDALAARSDELVVLCASVGCSRRAARERARARVRRRLAARPWRPLHAGVGSGASADPSARRRAGAHGPALPRSRCTAGQAAGRPTRSLVHALACEQDAAAGDEPRRRRPQRRRALVSVHLAEGARNRPCDRREPLSRRLRASARRRGRCSCSR